MSRTITINSITELIQLVETDFLTDYEKANEVLQALTEKQIIYLGCKDKADFIAQLRTIDEMFKKGHELPLFICESLDVMED